MGIFNLDSKFMIFMNKFADLLWLNVLTLVCSIPIFTIGASFTAMHYMVLKIYRNEEGYITRGFFKSFKENFRQSTVIWLIYLAVGLLLALDFSYVREGIVNINMYYQYALVFVAFVASLSLIWVFILQSRYTNTIMGTVKNAFIIGISRFYYSIMMIILFLAPIVCLFVFSIAVPFVVLLGFTVPAFLQAMLYSRIFDRMEGIDRKNMDKEEDGWSVELEENTGNTIEENKDNGQIAEEIGK